MKTDSKQMWNRLQFCEICGKAIIGGSVCKSCSEYINRKKNEEKKKKRKKKAR
jgi:ribosomal protein L32